MDIINYNKKFLIGLRAILFLLGLALGFLTVYQILDVYDDLVKSQWLRIMFFSVSMLVPAFALMLSAKSFYRILDAIGKKIMKGATSLKPNDLALVLISAIIGTFFGYACDLILSAVFNILALRLFLDILVGSMGIYFVLVFSLKLLRGGNENTQKNQEHDSTNSMLFSNKALKGYLLTLSALKSKKTYPLFSKLLVGEKFVLSADEKAVHLDETASHNLALLKADECITILDEQLSEGDDYCEILARHSLKLVVANSDDLKDLPNSENLPILILDELN